MEILEGISWQSYIIGIAAVALGYYLVVGILYFKKEINQFLTQRKKGGNQGGFVEVDDETPDVAMESHELLGELENLVNDIRASILEKAGKEATKETLLAQLKEKVAGFGGLHRPAYRYALNNFIIQHFKKNLGVAFSEEELDEAWESLPE